MNISKLKDQARKHELKDQLDKAIKTYVKILDELEGTPELEDELSLFNKVGDLYLKKKDAAAAVEMYETAADHYRSSGFPNNAIALYNKVLRAAPARTEAYLRLGELMVGRGFVAEARKNFDQYFERMEKDERLDDAFKALKQIADNAEDNEELRLLLAEHLKASARSEEAQEQLRLLYSETSAQGDERKSRVTLERMQAVDPDFQPEETGAGGGRSKKKQQSEIVFLDLESGEEEVLAPVDEDVPDALEEPEEETPFAEAPAIDEPGDVEAVEDRDTIGEIESPSEMATVVEEDNAAGGEGAFGDDDLITQAAIDNDSDSTAVEDDLLDLESVGTGGDLELEAPAEVDLESASAEADNGGDLEILTVGGAEEGVDMDMVLENSPGQAVDDELVLDRPDGVELEVEAAETYDEISTGDLDDLLIEPPEAPSLEDLKAEVEAAPDDAGRRHDYAEALIESGETEAGIEELSRAAEAFEGAGESERAVSVVDEILRLETSNPAYHRRKVELLSRMGAKERLVGGYLAYADALLRSGDMDGARTAYLNVLEHDAENEQAKTALETVVPDETAAATEAPADTGGDFVDLGELIFGDEDITMDTRMTADSAEQTGDEDADFKEMLGQFKKGIEENIGEEDSEAHYDLGVAFKEMGLLDEAIGEFQKALRGAGSRLKASEALGSCFFEKGQFPVAATVLQRAVDADTGSDEAKIGLLYWLGRCHEEQDKASTALEFYQRVFAVDINFQDVSERVAQLGG